MVACAFPEGVSEDEYWPLMALLGAGMSYRSVAAFMGMLFQRDPIPMYHDALMAASSAERPPLGLDVVRLRLVACGYTDWLSSDE